MSIGTGSMGVALKTDGTLWAWGWNGGGYLGQNNQVHYSSPVQVGSDTTWSKISAGHGHVTALKTDGTAWGIGSNSRGEIANQSFAGPGKYFSSPVQIGSETDWSDIFGHYEHTSLIKES